MNSIDLSAVSKEPEIESTESFVNIISVDVNAYAKEHFDKSVRKTLTIPAWLNNAALELGVNFSQVLQEALLAKIRSLYLFSCVLLPFMLSIIAAVKFSCI